MDDKRTIRELAFAGLRGDLKEVLAASVELVSTAGMGTKFLPKHAKKLPGSIGSRQFFRVFPLY